MDKFVTMLVNDSLIQWAVNVMGSVSSMDVNNPITWLKFIAACLIIIFALIILTMFIAVFGIGYLVLHGVLAILYFIVSSYRK